MYTVIIHFEDGTDYAYKCIDFEHAHDCMVDDYFNYHNVAVELVDPDGKTVEFAG